MFLLLYADDIVIFSETAEGLQTGLYILHDYCQRWKSTVNPNKSKILILEKAEDYPKRHRKLFFALNRYINKFVNINPSHVLDLFDKLISPILCYASEVWGFTNANNIERIHMQFLSHVRS